MKWLASQRVHFPLLAQIDPRDLTFALTPAWALSTRPLLPGEPSEILTPLVGQPKGDKIRIVTGFRRFSSALEWKLESLPMLLVDSAHPTPEVFKVPIIETRSQRELNLLELCTIVKKLALEWELPGRRVMAEYLPLLGLPPRPYPFKRLLRLARLSDPLQKGLGNIEEDILLGMASWSNRDQEFLLERINRLKLGRNKQRKLWQLTSELRDLEGPGESRLPVIWEKAGAVEVETRRDLSPSDTFHQLCDRLKRLRYPRLSELEDRKEELGSALGMPPPIQMKFPQFFEGEEIEFRFRARDAAELRKLCQALLQRSESPEMEELFGLL